MMTTWREKGGFFHLEIFFPISSLIRKIEYCKEKKFEFP